ncbi:low temperature requirement protein A [Planotetraspora phitsanulokensis]|uniref:Membrane protein n=1 Tax=Planotetraspora phitsanulokensis TaxID=575192 RepID=A0A8J3XCJ4_9ACTN|nr:low temperature requirement protein A [Planotetraspora phitsanulokensis]GII35736.1 membrane protein [Planotetraspora phitsanulokensis]
MSARPIDEPHRVSSQLELLFDLTFVVAVAAVTAELAHDIAEDHGLTGLVPFLQVFFAIWWAWMNFTWFASSYDTDDVAYRLLTMVQMAGVLVLAAGVPLAASTGDFKVVTLGYLVMRLALVAQWVRAGLEDPVRRRTALRYAAGIGILQIWWILRFLVTDAGVLPPWLEPLSFVCLAAAELAVPWWAEKALATTWHPHHIAERYGLFTIILLGESVLAASRGVGRALEAGDISSPFIVVAVSGLVLLFSLWWLYFLVEAGEGLSDRRHRSYLWGYGHYGIFAALAALGAGLEVAVEQSGHQVGASPMASGYAVAIPVGVCLVLLWAVHALVVAEPAMRPSAVLGSSILILLLPLAAPRVGVAAVVAAVTAICVLLLAATIAAGTDRGRRGGASSWPVISTIRRAVEEPGPREAEPQP